MKNFVILVLIILVAIVATGCALYGNEAQYNKGDWYWLADSAEVARIKQDKLAFNKLKNQPVVTTQTVSEKTLGYNGVVANLSESRRYKFKIVGPETKSWYLGPGQQQEDYLIPGIYTFYLYRGASLVQKPIEFEVGVQINEFMGKKYHWFVGAEW